ncbi:MAG: PadR family transcriptional regulator [Candidatus Aenigmarchaeota archaeon]|nr:PadR family transcriptional regulator [Candidatus Aenigmarchaeota archaeon]
MMHGKGHGPHAHCCDMRGMLSFLILFLLSKKPMHGQELAKELEKRKGDKPSPGTIYPALKALKEAGLIREKKSGKTITYSLTEEGERVLRFSKRQFCRIFMGVFPNRE